MFDRLVLSRPVATIAAGIVFLVTCSLGIWQLSRMQQKLDLAMAIKQMETRGILYANDRNWTLEAAEHRRMLARGRFLGQHTVFLDNRPYPQGIDPKTGVSVGYLVMTPLLLEPSHRVLWVNRGWLPRLVDNRLTVPQVRTPDGIVEVEGVVFAHPPRVMELGRGSTDSSVIQNLDIKAFEGKIPYPHFDFVLRQATEIKDDLVRDWAPAQSGAERHQGYAFQWFALAALTLSFWLLSGLKRKKID